MKFITLKKLALGTALMASAAAANAVPIEGEFSFNILETVAGAGDAVVPTPPASPLDLVSSLALGNLGDIVDTTGDFIGLEGPGFAGTIADLDPIGGGAVDPFATFGPFSFAADDWMVAFSQSNASVVNVSGIVSDGPGFDPTGAMMVLTFNRAGASYSGSGSFIAQPVAVPLPGTLLLTGLGLLGLIGMRKR